MAVWDTDPYICGTCKKKLIYIKEPVCKKCGKMLENECMELCMDCSRKKHEFEQGKDVFAYSGGMKESLYRFKYSNRREYARFYANAAYTNYKEWILNKKIQMIVPIPLHKRRQHRRGYNQAELFARDLGERMGIPVCTDLLIREKNTAPQKELTEAERKNNLKKAFKITGNIVQLKNILLVDDIYTTGSTIDAAAHAFKEAGEVQIFFICISIGAGL